MPAPNPANPAGYVAHDTRSIWGIGASPDDALTDALRWLREAVAEGDTDVPHEADLVVLPATSRLIAAVQRDGGECSAVLTGPVADAA